MPVYIIREDICKMHVDAIVNSTNCDLVGLYGVDGSIHKKGGEELEKACRAIGHLDIGNAIITTGGNLPCKYVIHTVGPIYKDGLHYEKEVLVSCYRSCMQLAIKYQCQSIAFCLISSGAYSYPKKEALEIAYKTINEYVDSMDIYLIVYDEDSYLISKELYHDIDNYIDGYLEDYACYNVRSMACQPASLIEQLDNLDESFSEMLFRKIDEKGISDVECYKKANIDRRLFSKIKSDKFYKPGKATVLAFAISLELSLNETNEMLEKAGYALSHSNKFDIIVEYFIKNKEYDIYLINEALFSFDQKLLGS